MKKTITVLKLAAALIALVILSGCASGVVPGGIVTEDKDFSDFTRVEVEGAFEVTIVQSDSYSTAISADDNFFDYITITQEGDTLRIYLNPHHTFADFTQPARTLKVDITMPALDSLGISGASKVNISDFKSKSTLKLVISGASSVTLADIEVGDLEFEVSGASKLSGSLKGNDSEIEVSGASTIDLVGSANNIDLDTSGASKVELGDFQVDNVNIGLSGASQATLDVQGRLDALLSGASILYFRGNPILGDITVTGASTIKNR